MTGNNRPGIVIQARDKHLLRELAAMRIIDREQAKLVAGFGSTTRANTRLLALYHAGLLRRFFQGTAAGGKKAVYACSETGARLAGVPYQRFRYRNDQLTITNFFVTHLYWVNWIYCWAKYQPPPTPGASFVRWVNFSEPVAASLTPDGYIEISTSEGIVASFVEVDLGSEGATIWKAKIQNYLRYAASGQFEHRFHVPRFRILVIANSEKRLQNIRKMVRAATDKIFWFATLEAIQKCGCWSSVWQRPADDQLRSLV